MEQQSFALTDKMAQPSARELYRFLCMLQGKGILSGQQECPGGQRNQEELSYIQKVSGQLPAILGLDYIGNDFKGVNERAVKWQEKGGIVSICWHWGIPPHGVGFHSSQERVDMEELLTPGTELYRGLLDNLDAAAEALKELCRQEIPVLWRPLHECDGGWFWWGKGGPQAFQKLWRLMYDRFTNRHALHNLIWVLGFSGEMHEGWYPGDDVVDCIGGDAYSEGIHEELYHWVKSQTSKQMPICHHENGPLPEPGLLSAKGVAWCWFLTWHTIHIHEQNSADYVNYVFNHPYVVTLGRLAETRKRLCPSESV